MNTQLRRLVAVGLVSGSLAISALVGAGAVGAETSSDRDTVVTRNVTVAAPALSVQENFGVPQQVISLADGRQDPR